MGENPPGSQHPLDRAITPNINELWPVSAERFRASFGMTAALERSVISSPARNQFGVLLRGSDENDQARSAIKPTGA